MHELSPQSWVRAGLWQMGLNLSLAGYREPDHRSPSYPYLPIGDTACSVTR